MFDDVLEIIQVVTDSETYQSGAKAAEKVLEFAAGHVKSKEVPKGGPIQLGGKATNYLIGATGLDEDGSFRRFLGVDPESMKRGIGMAILPDDAQLDNAGNAGQQGEDSGPNAPEKDRTIGGWFDP